ncbi:hypothetical protein F5Y14DRAFT_416524 [Nemania sp. NC0429]|nr:hypothetical protein F5Y14DRAFT_416524 [Nemania sp. NC0429]
MRFVAVHTSIPVPRVYCAFTHRGCTYIVMERIDGMNAGRGWVHRSEESKAKILSQLRDMVQQLRGILPPTSQRGVSNILGGSVYDPRLPAPAHWGPFSCVEDFHLQLRDSLALDTDQSDAPADLLELLAFYQQPFPDIKLTHGDLSSSNV